MASVIEVSMMLTPAIMAGVATIMTANAAIGILSDALNGGIEEDNIEAKETYQDENAEQGDSNEDDFFDAREGDPEKNNKTSTYEPSAPPPPENPYLVQGTQYEIPVANEVFERQPESLKVDAFPVHDETPTNESLGKEPSEFFNEKINISGVNIEDFKKVKFEETDHRSFIHAFYYLLNRGKKAADKKSLDDFITKYLITPLTKDMLPDNPLKVRFVMYQSGMYDEKKDTAGTFKPYRKVFDAMKIVATNQKLTLFQVLNIINACDNLNSPFKNFDALKENIKTTFLSYPAFAIMTESEQSASYFKEFPKLTTPDKEDFKLLLKVAKKMPEELLIDLERCLIYVSHAISYTPAYKALNKNYDEFIRSLITDPDEHAKFSRRNGVGDFLAAVLSDNGIKCITFYNSHGTPHTYRCDKKDVYSGGIIIYKYPNGHCVLLIPNKNKSPNLSASVVTTTTNSPQTSVKVDCNEYDKLFEAKDSTMGGSTRKRCRRRCRSKRRVTRKRLRRSHRTPLKKKSRKNPKKKI